MNETVIHLNLKLIEILKDQNQKFKVNGRNTRRRCDMSKVNNNNSRAMALFYLGVGRQVSRKYLPVQSQQYRQSSKMYVEI